MSGDDIRGFNVMHFGASVDTPEELTRFAEKLGADYPLLGDPTRAAAIAYGVTSDNKGYASRWTFYIGIDGKILYIDKIVTPENAGQVIVQKLAELGVARRPPRKLPLAGSLPRP